MIKLNEEYFDSRYYFLLREKKDGGHLWFSVSTTLAEAREQDDYVKFPKDMVNRVQKYLDKLVKIKKPKTQKEVKSELEELVDGDGSMNSSRIPILDPRLFPKRTMDQTVVATTQPGGYLFRATRGGRTYYSESEVKEEDMSAAFGYEETKDLPPKETIKVLKKMGVDNAVKRAKEFGKDPKINQGKRKKGSKMRIRLQEKDELDEARKQEMQKLVREILIKKKKGKDLTNKKELDDLSQNKNSENILKKIRKQLKNNIIDSKGEQ
jgi:hypothetical protein